MYKTQKNELKDRTTHKGKFWVKDPSLNYRQSSGVEFRGRYVDAVEFRNHIMRESVFKDKCNE